MEAPPVWLNKAEVRKKGALGDETLPNARYLLAPIVLPAPRTVSHYSLEGFNGLSRLAAVVRHPKKQGAFTREDIEFTWSAWGEWQAKRDLGSPELWMQTQNKYDASVSDWGEISYSGKPCAFALVWELGSVLSGSVSATARDLAQYVNEAARRIALRDWTLSLNQTVEEAAQNAERLVNIKVKFSQSMEMRLVPLNRPFFSQEVWRSAYALGMQWTDYSFGDRLGASKRWDRFVWPYKDEGEALFSVSAGESYGILTPDSAARNETVPGLTFWFELPTNPAPLETFDRMALAVNYFAQALGGRPVTPRGKELDGDTLEALRDDLEANVSEMARLGLAPGSPEAARFF